MKSSLTSDMSSEYSVTTQVSVFKHHIIVRHQWNMKSLDIFDASISKFNANYLGDAGIWGELLDFFWRSGIWELFLEEWDTGFCCSAGWEVVCTDELSASATKMFFSITFIIQNHSFDTFDMNSWRNLALYNYLQHLIRVSSFAQIWNLT